MVTASNSKANRKGRTVSMADVNERQTPYVDMVLTDEVGKAVHIRRYFKNESDKQSFRGYILNGNN